MSGIKRTMPTATLPMAIFLLFSFTLPCSGTEINAAPADSMQKVIPYKPGLKVRDLAAYQDHVMVELVNKRQISVGNLRRLEKAQQRMMAAKKRGNQIPLAVRAKPSPDISKARPLKTREDIEFALKQPDNATVLLPNGKIASVAQLKYVLPEVERRLGRKFGEPPQRPDRSGVVITVSQETSKEAWMEILKKPDATVLESAQNKKRITVGELKKFMAMRGKGRTDNSSRNTSAPATRTQDGKGVKK